jgi:threonyl-tRNA synthetase
MLYPDAQVTIGPVIDNGFFYDFAYKDGFSEGDLAKISECNPRLNMLRLSPFITPG